MAILEHDVRLNFGGATTGLSRRLFTRDEYYRLASAGLFDNQRIELIEGEIIEMTPIGPVHSAILEPLVEHVRIAFGKGFTVRNQVPISIGDEDRSSEPQPDLVVASGSWRNYLSRHPRPAEIKLIVEISDSSLADDRGTKAVLYASAQIREYWILNLIDNQLEVHRVSDGKSYQTVAIFKPDDVIKPIDARSSISVSDLLP